MQPELLPNATLGSGSMRLKNRKKLKYSFTTKPNSSDINLAVECTSSTMHNAVICKKLGKINSKTAIQVSAVHDLSGLVLLL